VVVYNGMAYAYVKSLQGEFARSTPETFKGLGLSQQPAFCPQKALLAGMDHDFRRKRFSHL